MNKLLSSISTFEKKIQGILYAFNLYITRSHRRFAIIPFPRYYWKTLCLIRKPRLGFAVIRHGLFLTSKQLSRWRRVLLFVSGPIVLSVSVRHVHNIIRQFAIPRRFALLLLFEQRSVIWIFPSLCTLRHNIPWGETKCKQSNLQNSAVSCIAEFMSFS